MVLLISIFLLVHECGHFFTAVFFNFETDKITFYPFGGISKFTHDINCPLKEELIVLLMGPIIQVILYLLLINIYKNNELITTINDSILIFNLLPIYPLDGGKIIHLLICYLTSYYSSFKIIYLISFGFLFIIAINMISNPTLNLLLIIILLLSKLISEKKNINYYLERFILERYLRNYNFKKSKIVSNTKEFKRDYNHLIREGNKYFLEKEYLSKKYKVKTM